jgi:hypothetical protein
MVKLYIIYTQIFLAKIFIWAQNRYLKKSSIDFLEQYLNNASQRGMKLKDKRYGWII